MSTSESRERRADALGEMHSPREQTRPRRLRRHAESVAATAAARLNPCLNSRRERKPARASGAGPWNLPNQALSLRFPVDDHSFDPTGEPERRSAAMCFTGYPVTGLEERPIWRVANYPELSSCTSLMRAHPLGTSTFTISGTSAIRRGRRSIAALKCSDPTCAAPAGPSRNASIKT
jgi:hypothetical protein